MSGSISVDIGYITKNIHTYIEQGTFFDLFEEEIISEVLKEAKLNPKSFNVLLTLAKSKYTTEELRIFASKCNVDVNSFEEAIIVLESYEKLLQLRPTHSLINYLKKYNNEGTEVQKKSFNEKNEIQNLRSQLAMMHNDNDYIITSQNNQIRQTIDEVTNLNLKSDFNTVYIFLKQISNNGDKLKMIISCAAGLSEKKDSFDNTPLLYACTTGDFQLTKSLIEGGCDRDAVHKYGNNCLVAASFNGHLEIVKYLIGMGIGKNWRNKIDGFDAILIASQNGHLEVVKYLVSIGCDVNSKQKDNANCIFMASKNGHLEVVKYLISVGANPNEKDNQEFNAILIASQYGHLEVVKYLVSIGCDANSKQKINANCIYMAASNGHINVVKYLVSVGANPNEKIKFGASPLIAASANGHLEIVKYLIQKGCNKNDKTSTNDSSLHYASSNGHFEVVEFFVSIHAQLSEKNNKGKTPLDCAKEKQNENENYRKIINILVQSGAK